MAENSTSLPDFKSIDELVEFFDSHDLGEYWDQMPEATFEVDIQHKTHLFALDVELANQLTKVARARQTSSQSLINTWLREKILEQA